MAWLRERRLERMATFSAAPHMADRADPRQVHSIALATSEALVGVGIWVGWSRFSSRASQRAVSKLLAALRQSSVSHRILQPHASDLSLFRDLDVGDEVAPVDVEAGVEAALMETLEEFDVALVGHPHLRAEEKGGENYGSVGGVGPNTPFKAL